jgi:hypothetical protein
MLNIPWYEISIPFDKCMFYSVKNQINLTFKYDFLLTFMKMLRKVILSKTVLTSLNCT